MVMLILLFYGEREVNYFGKQAFIILERSPRCLFDFHFIHRYMINLTLHCRVLICVPSDLILIL